MYMNNFVSYNFFVNPTNVIYLGKLIPWTLYWRTKWNNIQLIYLTIEEPVVYSLYK